MVHNETLSREEVRKKFRSAGLSVSDWASERGFNPILVYAVLAGNRKCLRGQSFRIAVSLGLKTGSQ